MGQLEVKLAREAYTMQQIAPELNEQVLIRRYTLWLHGIMYNFVYVAYPYISSRYHDCIRLKDLPTMLAEGSHDLPEVMYGVGNVSLLLHSVINKVQFM